jgi:hypothetical protein
MCCPNQGISRNFFQGVEKTRDAMSSSSIHGGE